MDTIYFDHHATTPCDERVVQKMLPYFTEIFGNPASLTHAHGRRAASAVEDARIAVARFAGVQPNEIVFTAGATESNNIALNLLTPGEHFVTSTTEHSSILAPADRLRAEGVEVTLLDPDGEGFVSAEAVRRALRPETRLVSIEAANAEIGTIQDLAGIAPHCRERGILLHSDVTQALGKIPVDFSLLDLASFSAHKLYGPKGVGGLYVRRGVRLTPVMVGGGQERGIRSGTVNVPAVVGLAAALELRASEMADEGVRLAAIRDALREALTAEIEGATINGPRELRLPGNLNVSFERVEAEDLMIAMRRFSFSAGSACSSGQRGSRVLKAIGADEARGRGAIRIGLGKSNTPEQADAFVADAKRAVARLREISPS